MRRLRISAAAQLDLDDIWIHVVSQSENPETGNKVLDEIGQRFGLLRHSPLAGRGRDDDFLPGDRSFPAGNYVIYYRIVKSQVVISRVIHSSRDQEKAFLDDRET